MDDANGFMITSRDRVLEAWQNSTELVRNYQQYSREFGKGEERLSRLFSEFAENEAQRAARLLVLLQEYDLKQEE